MAEGDEVRRPLGGLDSRHARDGERVALGKLAADQGASASALMRIAPLARAVRRDGAFPDTSTIRARPAASR
jgi:hypothetical protein